ncbi:MAG: hypothetical protein AAFQ66_10750 [Pseudomonadota bacterium]
MRRAIGFSGVALLAGMGAIVAPALPTIEEERGNSAPQRKFARCGGLSLYVASYLDRHGPDTPLRAQALRAARSYESALLANLPGVADIEERITARLRATAMVQAAFQDYQIYRSLDQVSEIVPWEEPGVLRQDFRVCAVLSQ